MKNLEMESYGVEELNHAEMVETDGGLFWIPIIIVAVLLTSCGNGNVSQSNKNNVGSGTQSNTAATHVDSSSVNTGTTVGLSGSLKPH